MIRRHPHVFADADGRIDAGAASRAPGTASRPRRRPSARRGGRAEPRSRASLLAGVKPGQPALTRAMELQRKASSVGFDWNDPRAVLAKIREEADEIEDALDRGDTAEIADETGDLMFALVNLARHVGADPEAGAARHQRQVRAPLRLYRARAGGAGPRLRLASLAEMDALWDEAKLNEPRNRF